MGIQSINAERKVDFIAPYMQKVHTLLDFGCGDLSMARALRRKFSGVEVNGIDIIDFGIRDSSIAFQQYDGIRIPFASKSFDVVVAYHVFHHTPDPESAFRDCVRVAKQRVIFVEPVWRHRLEVPGMMLMDWLFNVWKSRDVSLAFTFHSRAWWEEQIIRHNGRLRTVRDVEILPRIFPTGRSLLFIVDKKNV